MKRTFLSISFLIFIAVAAATETAKIDQVRVPKMSFKERKLANGLQVLSVQDRSTPTVSVQVWYRVGSKDDPEGRSGFAHLFEHLMFKSTRNMKDEMLDRLTEDVGGFNNASTYDDFTNYYEVVPSNYLETIVWAEADRMASLNVTAKNFPAERDVVKEEFRQNYLAPPYGMFFYMIEKRSFTTHPYRRPGIGSIEELNAATLEDVKKFHVTYYRPDNAVLIVVGDFDQQQLDGWVDKYFGRVPKPELPLPRVEVKEPQRGEQKRFTEYRPNVPLPAVGLTYLVPAVTNEDAAALKISEAILSEGESSRLYQSLVYNQQIAQNAFANADLRQDIGLYVVAAILASGKEPANVEKALWSEIKSLQEKPVKPAELEKAKNQLVTAALRERETSNGKAFDLAYAAVLMNDAGRVNTQIAELQAVQAADIQRVMKKYFTQNNSVVIYYLDESAKKSGAAAAKEGGSQ